MNNKKATKNTWKIWSGYKSHPWNFKDPKVIENLELALKYRQVKKICRKCYNKLPTNATKCRNKKCHCTDLRYAHDKSGSGGKLFSFFIPEQKIKALKNVKNID